LAAEFYQNAERKSGLSAAQPASTLPAQPAQPVQPAPSVQAPVAAPVRAAASHSADSLSSRRQASAVTQQPADEFAKSLRTAFRAKEKSWYGVRKQLTQIDSFEGFQELEPEADTVFVELSFAAFQRCRHAFRKGYRAPLSLGKVHSCEDIQRPQHNPRIIGLRGKAETEKAERARFEVKHIQEKLDIAFAQPLNQGIAQLQKDRDEQGQLECQHQELAEKDTELARIARADIKTFGIDRADRQYCAYSVYIRPEGWSVDLCELLESTPKNATYRSL
jgi:hypothetical protein